MCKRNNTTNLIVTYNININILLNFKLVLYTIVTLLYFHSHKKKKSTLYYSLTCNIKFFLNE